MASHELRLTRHLPAASVRSAPSAHPRALILDRRPVIGTEICRSMARRGFAVDMLGEANSPAFHSRFCARSFVAPSLETGMPFLEAVREVMRDNCYDAIFVCNEEVLEAMLSLPECGLWPGLPLPSRTALSNALSKSAMTEIARDAGVAVPLTVTPVDENELGSVAKDLSFPLVVKGDRGESGQRVRICRDSDELLAGYREIAKLERDGGRLISIQKHIAGVAYSVGGLFCDGTPLRVCAHRKLVTIPPHGGLTVSGITELCPRLLDEAFKIFKAVNYTGLGHVELIRDSNNRFNFIEINPRVWGTI